MKWPNGTAAVSVALFGRTFDPNHEEEGLNTSSSKGEFVIVGAGPAGLWTAVQIKLRLPDAHVIVYEKRPQFTREHMVRIGSDALSWSIGHNEPEIQELIQTQSKGYGIKLKELQTLLRDLANRIGIQFEEKTVNDGEEVIGWHPGAVAVIGADGRHSIVRETLFRRMEAEVTSKAGNTELGKSDIRQIDQSPGDDVRRDEFIDVRTLQHTIYINFEVAGDVNAHKLQGGALQNLAFSAADSILHAGAHPVRLVVGASKASSSRVSLTAIFFIDESTARSVATCSRRGPSGPGRLFGDARVPPALAQDVARYLRERFGDVAVDLASLELVYVAIDRYCARTAALHRGRNGVYLVGDACFGVPYFRALTNGLKCASTLAQYLAMPAAAPADTARAYRWYVYRLYRQALSAAEATALGSAALGCAVALGQTLAGGAPAAQAEEGRALAALGYTNHDDEEAAAAAAESAAAAEGGGGDGGWGALLRPITGRDEYEFGDVSRAALRGGRAAVGAATRGGVGAAAAALHGFVGLTGLRL